MGGDGQVIGDILGWSLTGSGEGGTDTGSGDDVGIVIDVKEKMEERWRGRDGVTWVRKAVFYVVFI